MNIHYMNLLLRDYIHDGYYMSCRYVQNPNIANILEVRRVRINRVIEIVQHWSLIDGREWYTGERCVFDGAGGVVFHRLPDNTETRQRFFRALDLAQECDAVIFGKDRVLDI